MKARIVACAILLVVGAPAHGQEHTGPNLAAEGTGQPGGVAQLAFAQELYALGLARNDALAVLTAARLASAVTLHDVDRAKETQAVEDISPVSTEGGGPVEPREMMDTARRLAGNDEGLLGLVEQAEADEPLGNLTAGRTKSTLDAGLEDVWKLPFFGGALAEVAMIGDGDANLDLRIVDEGGTTICQSSSAQDGARCDWIPAWNGYFTVTVTNLGPMTDSYFLLTN